MFEEKRPLSMKMGALNQDATSYEVIETGDRDPEISTRLLSIKHRGRQRLQPMDDGH